LPSLTVHSWPLRLLLGLLLLALAALAQAKSITLNMKNADINAVIGTVAEVTGKNFIIDPRVKGKVTIISSRPLDAEQVYQVFLAMLDVHGYAAVPAGEVIKILPDADAKHAGMPARGKGEEIVTQVIAVKHVSAAQLVPILRPLVPPQGHLAAHAQTNTLIVADRVSNIRRLLRIVQKIDEPSSSEIEVVPLQHASATEVVRILTSLRQQKKKKDPKSAAPTLVADERTNSILLGGEKSERLQIKAIIAHLDTPSETSGNTHVVYLRYAKAKDMVTVLTGVGKVKAKDKKGGGASRRQQNFDIQADESANALVITASPDVYRSLESVIRKLDVRRAQVLVEAIIAEVSMNQTSELGIQWFAGSENPGSNPVGVTNFGSNGIVQMGAAANALSRGQPPTSLPIGNGLTMAVGSITSGRYSFGALINALAGDGRANLLSTPNIVTMDNEEAEIFVGKEVSIPSGAYSVTGTVGSINNPFTTFKAKQVGIRLKVKPQINEGDAIKLDIDQNVDAITAGNAGEANLVTSQRSIKTSVMVDDGQIVVLGGLITNDENQSVQKVPLLGDIPVLGALFRYKRNNTDKTNLMVFLRPQILRDAAVAAAVTGDKYNYMRAKQLEVTRGQPFLQQTPAMRFPPLSSFLPPATKDDKPQEDNRLPGELEDE